ncbi:hypothetical protein ACFO4N_13915 [Camelliibacillus cellulosilyticus]|uniref:Tetratricopeptide repeat protein n=1 Tax=Camelliibacillus cellulosilyticus TaxID=2174486 RepID=A0ABV9GRJ4_9BACL
MVQNLSTLDIAKLLNDWHQSIKLQNMEEAKRIKMNIDEQKDHIEHDSKNMIYYLLLDARQKLLLYQMKEARDNLLKLETRTHEMDGYLTYYYHFYKGDYEYNTEQFEQAIESYQHAEEALKYIPNAIEHAEFHYKVAAAYLQIDFLTLALQHAENALDIYISNKEYVRRTADSHVLLGSILTEVRNYDKALFHYEEALGLYQRLKEPISIAIMKHNLAVLYSKNGESKKAIDYFQNSLNHTDQLSFRLKTFYYLAEEYFKIGDMTKGSQCLKTGYEIATSNSEKAYAYRYRVLEAFHLKPQEIEQIVPEAIQYFKKLNLWDFVEGYSLDFAEYYKEQGNHQKASEWLLSVVRAGRRFSSK